MNLSGKTKVMATPKQVSTQLDDESVILSMNDGVYYGLNEVGTRIWELVKEPTTVDSIVETLLQEYKVEADQCRQEVCRLLEEMLAKELVVFPEATGTESLDGVSGSEG